MKSLKSGILTCAVFAALAHPALAWDKFAHMVVGQIAVDHLKPAAKAEVVKLIALLPNNPDVTDLDDKYKPYNDVTVAAWMDDMRSASRQYNTWHYVDLPAPPAGTAQSTDALKAYSAANAPNAYDVIVNKCIPTLKDPNASDADKAKMLGFLFHLEGDVHQPLHAIDTLKGGNGFLIQEMPGADPDWEIKNLHSFWDNAYRYDVVDGKIVVSVTDLDLPRSMTDDNGTPENVALAFEKKYERKEKKPAKDLDPADWVVESNNIATGFAFNAVEDKPLTADYVGKASKIARQRIVLAGLRLANLLNSIFAD
jgi:hypothetical protein